MKLSERIRDYRAGMFGALKIQDEWADEVEQLEEKYVNVLEVAIARGEKLGYLDEDYREKLDALKEGADDTQS